MSWRPLTRPPRRGPLIQCCDCHRSVVNEERNLRGWEESTAGLRLYRCPDCSQSRET